MPTSKLQVIWVRTPSGHTEDDIITTHHFQSPTQGLLIDATMAAVEGHFQTLWTSWKGRCRPEVQLAGFRWYDQQVYPTRSPLVRSTDITKVPGTAAGTPLPDQIAVSITHTTAYRKRWGRSYMPTPTSASLQPTEGRWTTSEVDSMCANAKDFYNSCKGSSAIPVVWSPKGAFGPPASVAGSVLNVLAVKVDMIPDVIRSRRQQDNYYSKTIALS